MTRLPVTTVIFDLDGLLADTEPLHRRAYRDVLGAHGVPLPDAVYDEHWIRLGKGIGEFLREHALTLDADAIRRGKADRYDALVAASARPMPGARELVEALQGRKTLVLASASYRRAVLSVLRAIGLDRAFALVAAKESVPRVKPFPDAFLHVAERLGVRPAHCLVLEDSEKGVRAAQAAGMRCIAVPNAQTRDHDFSGATLVVESLCDLTPERLDAL